MLTKGKRRIGALVLMVAIVATVFLLSGCGAAVGEDQTTASSPSTQVQETTAAANAAESAPVTEDTEAQENINLEGNPAEVASLTEDMEALAEAADVIMDEAEVSTDVTGYPSIDEILAAIDADTHTLYWLADAPDISGTIDIWTVEQPDMDSFWSNLSTVVGDSYSIGGDKVVGSLHLIPNDSSVGIDVLLDAMEQVTGLSYIQVDSLEGYTSGYVPQINGVSLDAVGYSSDNNGGYFAGTYIGVTENGQVTIVNPLILTAETETVNISELVTVEAVETVCRAYYEANFVTVFTAMSMEYYYADGQLLPAWVCDYTFYMDENGHQDSVMLDAQTGELIRK